jgi:phosphoribosylformimino-5-aminoimidazole carboxamide ribotide isomerase
MRVVPVLDLMAGRVVRGVAGRRDAYQPFASPLCPDAQPATAARALVEQFGFTEMYVADLDAILGRAPPAFAIYEQLAALGLRLVIDAGVREAADALRLQRFCADSEDGDARAALTGIVAGLETLPTPQALGETLAAIGPERLVFSLDLKNGLPLTSSSAWQPHTAPAIAARAFELGVRRMIVLDLARVGVGEGVGTEDLGRSLRAMQPEAELIAGGGVRGPGDLDALESAGYDAVLVASALHDGRITPTHLPSRRA